MRRPLATHAQSAHAWIWGLLFIAVPVAYHPGIYDGALLPKLLVLQAGLLLLLLATGLRQPGAFRCSPLLLPIGCYMLLATLSVANSLNRVESVLQLSQYLALSLIPIAAFHTLREVDIPRIVRAAVWVGLPLSVIGIGQYFGWELPDTIVRYLGWGIQRIPSSANPSATFFHRNAAAEYLIGIIPLTWVCLVLTRSRPWIAAHAALAATLTTYLIYTRARGAWLGLLCATAVILVTTRLIRFRAAPLAEVSNTRFRRVAGVLAGHQYAARRCTDGGARITLRKACALDGKLVDIRRLYLLLAVTA